MYYRKLWCFKNVHYAVKLMEIFLSIKEIPEAAERKKEKLEVI